jgi:D-alanyl-D-alanine carboxypeptidase
MLRDMAAPSCSTAHTHAAAQLDELVRRAADHASAPGYAQAVLAAPRRRWSRTEQLALALEQPGPGGGPGACFRYSDTGYVLLGEIVERVTREPLGVAVRRLLRYELLGLRHTWWEDDEPAAADAAGLAPQWLASSEATGFDASFDRHGGGGIVSTVDDLVRFASALFADEVLRQPRTLAAACVIPPCVREPGASLHGRLAMVLPMGPAWAWGHLGYWGCGVAHCPSLGVTVAATVNQAYPADPAWRTQLVSRLGCVAVELAMTCPTGRSTNPAGTRQPLAMSTSLPAPRLAGSSR